MRAMHKSMRAATIGAAALAITAITPAHAGVVGPMSTTAQTGIGADIIHKARRRGRRGLAIGAGILTLGIIGAIAASERARARRYDRRYYYDDYEHQCRRLLRRCRRGNDRACWRYDNRC